MTQRSGFTLVELMIIIVLIGILAGVLFPVLQGYQARGRDVTRIGDIRTLSQKLQDYSHSMGTYPSNINPADSGSTSYCWSDIVAYPDGVAKDAQFSVFGGTGVLIHDPIPTRSGLGACLRPGSYYYARVTGPDNNSYAVIAAKMELATTGANYTGALWLNDPAHIDEMIKAEPLNKKGNYTGQDPIFLIATN